MTKKLILGMAALGAALIILPLVAAFEAHVINVVAQIENALNVHPESRTFGTVFPQEHLAQGIFVSFSTSFSASDQTRVGTVEYKIVQKPKPLPEYETEVGIPAARLWCHDNYPQTEFNATAQEWINYRSNCYPLLCPYLSKEPDNHPSPGNDTGVPAFHDPFDPSSIATGKIEKFSIDVGDTWIIDLAVPCFEGHCAQDWASFVTSHNPEAIPDDFMLPLELEHEVFGCDLWFEVTDIY